MDRHAHGQVRTEVVDDRILVMTVDRVEKKNAFTPKISNELAAALHPPRRRSRAVRRRADLRRRPHHRRVGDAAVLRSRRRPRRRRADAVDPFGLQRRLTKPLVTAVQGITFTIGIEIALAGDIIVAASDTRFCQLEPKRGLAPLGGATIRYVQRAGWGNAMYHLLRADEFTADEALRIGLVQEVVEPGAQRDRAIELARELLQCAPLGAAAHHRQRADSRSTRTSPTAIDCHRGDEQGGHGDGRLPRGDRVVRRTTPGAVHGTLT